MYKESFKDLVNFAVSKSYDFYNNLENVDSPNPYFIGFGNPNAKILILGKEKGFDKNNLQQLKYESINNPEEWNNYIKNDIVTNKNKFYESEHYINSFFPYLSKNKSGHTWNKYHTLLNHIYTSIPKFENEFFEYAFLSEINYIPSKYSEIKRFDNHERLKMLSSEFFKSFEVVILACGSYLKKEQIENIFSVSYSESILKSRENIHIYQNSNQLIINTRQLSMDASNDLLIKIAEFAKNIII
jgi:hypothetical protein